MWFACRVELLQHQSQLDCAMLLCAALMFHTNKAGNAFVTDRSVDFVLSDIYQHCMHDTAANQKKNVRPKQSQL